MNETHQAQLDRYLANRINQLESNESKHSNSGVLEALRDVKRVFGLDSKDGTYFELLKECEALAEEIQNNFPSQLEDLDVPEGWEITELDTGAFHLTGSYIDEGELISIDENHESYRDALQAAYEHEDVSADVDYLAAYSFVESCPDINFISGRGGSYEGAILFYAIGGPNIRIDTTKGNIIGSWGGGDEVIISYCRSASHCRSALQLDDAAESLFDSF